MVPIRFRTRLIAVFLAALFLPPCLPAHVCAEGAFSVQRVGQMISNRENAFSVDAPEDGVFSVTIRDDYYTYRIIETEVPAGSSLVEWDGCGYNSERLPTQFFTFDFTLEGKSGKSYSYTFRSSVIRNDMYLQFVLPSGDTAYLGDPEGWFIEIKATCDGTVSFNFAAEGDEADSFSIQKPLHTGRVEHYAFGKLIGSRKAAPGRYTVSVYEISRPDNVTTFPLEIRTGTPVPGPVEVTGDIMPPAGADDSGIWAVMMRPSVVVKAEYNKSVPVYAEADKGSASLGTLHGATQCLSVFELREGWARIGAWNHESADYIEGWIPADSLTTVQPNSDYGLLVNKKDQTITVFYRGERLETLLVSTGHMDPNKLIRETAAGMYLTGLHRVDFSMQGSRYDYVIQYDGGNLLHQIPYSSAGKKDFTWGKAYLGSKASHACIRIQDTPGEQNGINAYWIWTHIPYHTKVIILDDPEERFKTKAILSGTTPDAAAEGPLLLAAAPENRENTVVLSFGGSVTAGNSEEYFYAPDSICTQIEQNGAEYPFSGMQELFAADDYTCVVLDSTLKRDAGGADRYRSSRYRGLPEYAAVFPAGNVEMACLTGEHVYDYREDGFASTVAAVGTAAEWIGYGHTSVVRIKDHLFGFAACTEAEYLQNPGILAEQVRFLRDSGCEVVICQCGWGSEKEDSHNKLQEAMARACERAGADLLIGYVPGRVQGIDRINEMPVVYSLGSLLPAGAARMKSRDTLVVQAVFDLEDINKAPALVLVPVLSGSTGADKSNICRPVPAEGEDRERVLDTVQKDTACNIRQAGNQ